MTELIRNAWLGWEAFITDGKLAALFFAALLFLWLRRGREVKKAFLLYSAVTAVFCVLPFTAALMMLYQTRFYDYEWIWSFVPLTAVTAYGMTEFLAEYWKDPGEGLRRKGLSAAALMVGAVLLCGSLGKTEWKNDGEAQERQRAKKLLEELREVSGDEELCLWAPREVLEYVREFDGKVRLVYGRNMWDPALNAYSYDTYSQPVADLYRWMEWQGTEEWLRPVGGELSVTAEQCAQTAAENGVNCILLPAGTEEDQVALLEAALDVRAGRLEGYYLFLLQK